MALGAYTQHHLRPLIGEALVHSVGIAQQYQLVHALLIVLLAVAALAMPAHALRTRLEIAGWILALGVGLFSGGIHLAALLGEPGYTQLAPLGGTLLMLGWAVLASAVWTRAP